MEYFTQLHYILGLILLGYGIVLGFRNTLYRVASIITARSLNQSTIGYLLDGLFYSGIGYLTLVYFNIIQ